MIRRILVDHARKRQAAKRDAAAWRMATVDIDAPDRAPELLSLDQALSSLERLDPQQAKVAERRFFAGLTVEETVEVAGISAATVKREWRTAKAWLRREIGA